MTGEELGCRASKVRMGGPPVDNVAISDEGEKTLIRLFIPAGIVGLSLAFWCLRSVRLTTMVFGAALYAGAISLAIVYYSGGSMNAILLTMPAVVYVAGISGAIHFANYYRDSVAESGVEGAPARAVQTFVAALHAFGWHHGGRLDLAVYQRTGADQDRLASIRRLGVLATLGLLFLFLPSWMQLWPMRPHSLLDGDQPKAEDIDLPVQWRRRLAGRAESLSPGVRQPGWPDDLLRRRADEDQHLDQAYQAVFFRRRRSFTITNGWKTSWVRWCRWKSSSRSTTKVPR